MTRIEEAMLLSLVLLAVALLAVAGIIPESFAQYAPLAVVPFVVRRGQSCRGRLAGRGA